MWRKATREETEHWIEHGTPAGRRYRLVVPDRSDGVALALEVLE